MGKLKKISTIIGSLLAVAVIAACDGDPVEGDFAELSEIMAHAKTLTYSENGGATVSNPGTPNFTVPAEGYDGSAVTIKFYHTMGSNLSDVLNNYITKFNELYPNITIEHEQVGGYDDVKNQIATEIQNDQQPNLAYCYPDHVAMYNMSGAVANLDNLINSEITITRADDSTEILGLTQEQKDDFIEGYYNEGKQFGDGLMYSMPFSKSTEVLYYNETYFTENHLSLPTHWFSESEDDTTSMEAVCAKIKELNPNSIPLGYDSESNWFITMAEQCGAGYTSAGSDHYLFDNSTMHTLMLKFREWYNKGYVTTQTIYGSYTSGLFTTVDGNTNSYMSIGSSAGATHQRPSKVEDAYPFTVGITEIPQISQTYKRVISQGPSVVIFDKPNKQEVVASWLFTKYLTTSVAFQAEFSMASGYVPVLKSVASNPVYQAFTNKANGTDYVAALAAKVCLEQEQAYYTSPAFNGSSTARDQVGPLLVKCISGQCEDENLSNFILQAFKDAIDECEYQA